MGYDGRIVVFGCDEPPCCKISTEVSTQRSMKPLSNKLRLSECTSVPYLLPFSSDSAVSCDHAVQYRSLFQTQTLIPFLQHPTVTLHSATPLPVSPPSSLLSVVGEAFCSLGAQRLSAIFFLLLPCHKTLDDAVFSCSPPEHLSRNESDTDSTILPYPFRGSSRTGSTWHSAPLPASLLDVLFSGKLDVLFSGPYLHQNNFSITASTHSL